MENTDNENLDESVYDPLKNILPDNFLDHFHAKWDGSIKVWGNSAHGETSAPSTGVYTKVYSNAFAFAALKADLV
jgi:hypothetical protein